MFIGNDGFISTLSMAHNPKRMDPDVKTRYVFVRETLKSSSYTEVVTILCNCGHLCRAGLHLYPLIPKDACCLCKESARCLYCVIRSKKISLK